MDIFYLQVELRWLYFTYYSTVPATSCKRADCGARLFVDLTKPRSRLLAQRSSIAYGRYQHKSNTLEHSVRPLPALTWTNKLLRRLGLFYIDTAKKGPFYDTLFVSSTALSSIIAYPQRSQAVVRNCLLKFPFCCSSTLHINQYVYTHVSMVIMHID